VAGCLLGTVDDVEHPGSRHARVIAVPANANFGAIMGVMLPQTMTTGAGVLAGPLAGITRISGVPSAATGTSTEAACPD
jgi:hypothetical protein